MIDRAYRKGESVRVDPGVFTASPTSGEHTVPCTVLLDSYVSAQQVYLARDDNCDTLYVFKTRVTP